MKKIFNIKAFVFHLLLSVIIIGGLSFFVVSLWFPYPWATELGGYDLIIKILIIDLFIGPVCVGLCYKTTKKMALNILDIVIVTTCQLLFFSWGAWTISISRPVFIVFDTDRYEVVVENNVIPANLAKVPPFNQIQFFSGPKMAIVDIEKTIIDPKERQDAILAGMFGSEPFYIPKYYVEYNENKDIILRKAKRYEDISKKEFKEAIDQYMHKKGIDKKNILWLPLRYYVPTKSAYYFMGVVISPESGMITDYIFTDPY